MARIIAVRRSSRATLIRPTVYGPSASPMNVMISRYEAEATARMRGNTRSWTVEAPGPIHMPPTTLTTKLSA